MASRLAYFAVFSNAVCWSILAAAHVTACCPCPVYFKHVVNADQTVITIWDTATQTQHFIRKASFKSESDDFGFVIPSPWQPELSESGNDAFSYLQGVTAPEYDTKNSPRNFGLGCGGPISAPPPAWSSVRVLEEKHVAGFKATVLEASSASGFVDWLRDNGYSYSPEIQAWAEPYVRAGWKFTALKVIKDPSGNSNNDVTAGALRMSFKTDRPLFPYREPESKDMAAALNAKSRTLRIFFIAEARYKGELTRESPWTGQVAWSNKLSAEQKSKTLELLKLPSHTGPADWWLTEYEDNWPYKLAPADVYFSRDTDQHSVKRPKVTYYAATLWPNDVMMYAIAALVVIPPMWRRRRVAVRA